MVKLLVECNGWISAGSDKLDSCCYVWTPLRTMV